jgi:hypothetical protein
MPRNILGPACIEDPFALLRLASWVSVRVQGRLVARTLSALVRTATSPREFNAGAVGEVLGRYVQR